MLTWPIPWQTHYGGMRCYHGDTFMLVDNSRLSDSIQRDWGRYRVVIHHGVHAREVRPTDLLELRCVLIQEGLLHE